MGHHEEGQLAFFAVVGFSRSGTISVSGVRVWERERERERETYRTSEREQVI